MNIHAGDVGVMGVYTFELNGVPVFDAPSKNLITDFGWTKLSNLTFIANTSTMVQVGTSNTPPALTDVALGALVAQRAGNSAGTTGTGTDGIGAYSYTRTTHQFALGAVVGNIAEVGFKVDSGDSSLSSRSLVKDGLGNPAVIVVTASDQLTVNYELRYYRAALDLSSSVTVAGVPTTYLLRTASAVAGTSSNNAQLAGMSPTDADIAHYGTGSVFGAVGVDVSGTASSSSAALSGKVITVNPTNTVVTFNGPFVPTGNGNSTGGVLNAQLTVRAGGSMGAYGIIKMNFTPAIPKDSTKTVSYSFSFTFTRL